eukprot:sb/3465900/
MTRKRKNRRKQKPKDNIQKLYINPVSHGAFAGKESFYRSTKEKIKGLKRSVVEKTLLKSDPYTLHKPVRKPRRYRRIYSRGINYHFQADLVDMSAYSKQNNGFKWIMMVIDTFSKRLWAFKLKNKSAKSVYDELEPLLTRMKPQKFETDGGGEFKNKLLMDLFSRLNIDTYTVYSDRKCAIIERCNRTIKSKLYRAFTSQGSHRWVDILEKLIRGYNNSYHRSIRMKPSQVNKSNENEVRENLYPKEPSRSRPKLQVGNTVRVSRMKDIFQKGYEQTWSHEVFTVDEVRDTNPVTYRLQDSSGEILQGSFYEAEVQKVDVENQIYTIDKVLKTRKHRGHEQFFVSFKGYPESENRWVDKSDMFDI